jgi:catechol 2,3-dioxygenase-like lactoylglutathione lyase family enzyme
MTVELNHTIVRSSDKQRSAAFLAELVGLEVAPPWGPFLPVPLSNGVTLEFVEVSPTEIQPQHYAFLVTDAQFDAAFNRIKDAGVPYFADPFRHRPAEVNHEYGGRGIYFDDPDGHNLELMTVPYGDAPGM